MLSRRCRASDSWDMFWRVVSRARVCAERESRAEVVDLHWEVMRGWRVWERVVRRAVLAGLGANGGGAGVGREVGRGRSRGEVRRSGKGGFGVGGCCVNGGGICCGDW